MYMTMHDQCTNSWHTGIGTFGHLNLLTFGYFDPKSEVPWHFIYHIPPWQLFTGSLAINRRSTSTFSSSEWDSCCIFYNCRYLTEFWGYEFLALLWLTFFKFWAKIGNLTDIVDLRTQQRPKRQNIKIVWDGSIDPSSQEQIQEMTKSFSITVH